MTKGWKHIRDASRFSDSDGNHALTRLQARCVSLFTKFPKADRLSKTSTACARAEVRYRVISTCRALRFGYGIPREPPVPPENRFQYGHSMATASGLLPRSHSGNVHFRHCIARQPSKRPLSSTSLKRGSSGIAETHASDVVEALFGEFLRHRLLAQSHMWALLPSE